ncbi:unnamed protein product [Parnassius apollo]|uniref:(apollo) hypothetical protein n=1 Tax=Parnassius apollo TaxID=110799 RepID=A0A8S3Y8T6_PARAO|nr:unnamed protein product [Parnassius apollo]
MSSRIHKDNLIAGVKKHHGITTEDLGHGGELKKIFVNMHLTLDNKRLYKKCREIATELGFVETIRHHTLLSIQNWT